MIRDLLVHARAEDIISLAGGLPATEMLPAERLSATAAQVLLDPSAAQYGPSAGEPALREALALDLSRPEEPVDPNDLVITTGSQQALDLVVRSLSRPGDTVCIEDPGYIGAVQTMRASQMHLHGVPVDAEGMSIDALEAAIADGAAPQLCYVNPNFQNPTGAVLSPERATRLVELAERHEFFVIADDPYRALSFSGAAPVDLPPSPHVIRLGSMSKTLSPGLRVGWLHAHPDVIERVTLAKQGADLHTPTLNQLIVASLMSDTPWWNAHLASLRASYGQRRDVLLHAVRTHLPQATVRVPEGGFFLWLDDLGVDLAAALDAGVAFVPGHAFAINSDLSLSARLSFSSAPLDQIDTALRRLATVAS